MAGERGRRPTTSKQKQKSLGGSLPMCMEWGRRCLPFVLVIAASAWWPADASHFIAARERAQFVAGRCTERQAHLVDADDNDRAHRHVACAVRTSSLRACRSAPGRD